MDAAADGVEEDKDDNTGCPNAAWQTTTVVATSGRNLIGLLFGGISKPKNDGMLMCICLLNTKSLSRDGFVTRNQAESERKKSVEIQDVEFFSLFTSAETERSIERGVYVFV